MYSVTKYEHGWNMASYGTCNIHLVKMYEIELDLIMINIRLIIVHLKHSKSYLFHACITSSSLVCFCMFIFGILCLDFVIYSFVSCSSYVRWDDGPGQQTFLYSYQPFPWHTPGAPWCRVSMMTSQCSILRHCWGASKMKIYKW